MKINAAALIVIISSLIAASSMAYADAPSINAMLAKADIVAGEKTAHNCQMCHSFGKGEPNKTGPNLWDIIGSNHARLDNYNYSSSMKALHDTKWTYDTLNQFLYSPQSAIAGTKMAYPGIKDTNDRANLIAYLRTLSDSPLPLPGK